MIPQSTNPIPPYLTYKGGYDSTTPESLVSTETQKKSAEELAEEQKQMFLKLLITEIQYQNPLEPMGNSDFVAQLAQFSTLEELGGINAQLAGNMESIEGLVGSIQQSLITNLFGKQVEALGGFVEMTETGEQQELSFELDGAAQLITVNILDSSGSVVRSLYEDTDKLAGRNTMTWDGFTMSNIPASPGVYQYVVNARNAAGDEVSASALTSGVVTGVDFVDGVAQIHIGQIAIPYNLITLIKQPE